MEKIGENSNFYAEEIPYNILHWTGVRVYMGISECFVFAILLHSNSYKLVVIFRPEILACIWLVS